MTFHIYHDVCIFQIDLTQLKTSLFKDKHDEHVCKHGKDGHDKDFKHAR